MRIIWVSLPLCCKKPHRTRSTASWCGVKVRVLIAYCYGVNSFITFVGAGLELDPVWIDRRSNLEAVERTRHCGRSVTQSTTIFECFLSHFKPCECYKNVCWTRICSRCSRGIFIFLLIKKKKKNSEWWKCIAHISQTMWSCYSYQVFFLFTFRQQNRHSWEICDLVITTGITVVARVIYSVCVCFIFLHLFSMFCSYLLFSPQYRFL